MKNYLDHKHLINDSFNNIYRENIFTKNILDGNTVKHILNNVLSYFLDLFNRNDKTLLQMT